MLTHAKHLDEHLAEPPARARVLRVACVLSCAHSAGWRWRQHGCAGAGRARHEAARREAQAARELVLARPPPRGAPALAVGPFRCISFIASSWDSL